MPVPRYTLLPSVPPFAAAGAILLCLLAWVTNPFPLLGIDDADIILVYARNIAEGLGYVYVAGGERIEGSTSLLWTLVCVAIHAIAGENYVRPAAFLVGIALTLASVLVLMRLMALVSPRDRMVQWLLLLWLAANPLFFLWNSVTLMDLGLFTATLYALVLFCCSDHRNAVYAGVGLGITGAALALTRPEGMALAPMMCALAAAGHWARTEDRHGALAMFGCSIAVLTLLLGAVTLGRIRYFDYPFPNTFYAKVSSHPIDNLIGGLRYGWRYVKAQPWMVLVATAGGLAVLHVCRQVIVTVRARQALSQPALAMLVCSSAAAFLFALPLLTGDDHFQGFRFMQPASALIPIPALYLVRASRGPACSWRVIAMLAVILIAGTVNWSRYVQEQILKGDFRIAHDMKGIAGVFNEHVDPHNPPTVGVLMAGGFALAFRGPVFDMLGLNDVEMAHASGRRSGIPGHSAFNEDVFWRRHPDIVAPQRFDTAPSDICDAIFELDNRILGGLYFSDRFANEYVLGFVHTKDDVVSAFFSRRWLSSLKRDWVTVADASMRVDNQATCHRPFTD